VEIRRYACVNSCQAVSETPFRACRRKSLGIPHPSPNTSDLTPSSYREHLVLLLSGSGLLGLLATGLWRWGLTDWALGLADGGGTGDSGGTEISTVTVAGDSVGNSLVGPGATLVPCTLELLFQFTHLREEPPRLALTTAFGCWAADFFLVRRVTPFSAARTPTAFSLT
jgi:hypothetical protein